MNTKTIHPVNQGLRRCFVFSLFSLFSLASASVLSAATLDDLQFTEINNGTEYSVSAKDPASIAGALTIPATHNGKPVTQIADRAFYYSPLTSISLPITLTSIGTQAFSDCTFLTSIDLSHTAVTSIGNHAFNSCINLPSIRLTQSLTSIGERAFASCNQLTSVTFLGPAPTLGSDVFADTGSMVIPGFIITIYKGYEDTYASWKTSYTVNVVAGGPPTIDDLNFTLINNDTEYAVSAKNPKSLTSALTIPATYNGKPVTEIADLGFGVSSGVDRPAITSVSIPSSIKVIGNSAFKNCRTLSTVTFAPNSQLTTIGTSAFAYCQALTGIELPNSLSSMGQAVFGHCTALTAIYLSNTALTAIDQQVFYNCIALTSVSLPQALTEIGSLAFSECTALASVNFPKDLKSIGSRAFYNCNNLTVINLSNTALSSIGDWAFYECTSLTTIALPQSLTTLGDSAFYRCNNLTSIDLSNTALTSIGSSTFSHSALTSIHLPKTLASIEDRAFYNCRALTSITFPNTLTSIGDQSFAECILLASLNFLGSAPTLASDVFLNTGGSVSGGSTFIIQKKHEASFNTWGSNYTFNVVQPVLLLLSASYSPASKALSITTKNEPSSVTLTLQHKDSLGGAWADLSFLDYIQVSDSTSGTVTRMVTLDPATKKTGFYRIISTPANP